MVKRIVTRRFTSAELDHGLNHYLLSETETSIDLPDCTYLQTSTAILHAGLLSMDSCEKAVDEVDMRSTSCSFLAVDCLQIN